MVWLRRCTHYLFIVVVAVNSTLLTINSGDYIFCVKVGEEGTTKKSNGQIAAALAATTAIMLYVALYVS